MDEIQSFIGKEVEKLLGLQLDLIRLREENACLKREIKELLKKRPLKCTICSSNFTLERSCIACGIKFDDCSSCIYYCDHCEEPLCLACTNQTEEFDVCDECLEQANEQNQ